MNVRSLPSLLSLLLILTGCTATGGDEPTTTGSESTTVTTATNSVTPSGISYAGTVPAPEFPDGLDWINTDGPIAMADLTGKIVLLDFWTYGCINCIHVIPDLKRLEEEYPEELVVIGVHSAKFSNEGETDNIRQVVQRYEVDHPVVNDRDFAVWRSWGAQAWPTLALVDPAGNVVGTHAGEGVYDTVQPVIEALRTEFAGIIDPSPVQTSPERAGAATTLLSFPGKVAVGNGLLYVSDTGHHRVIAADPASGEIEAVYGDGKPGFANGPALQAEFDSPQGIVYDPEENALYVADTNNHAIRVIDVASGTVETLTGTGALGWPPAAALMDSARLNSPWGLTLRDGDLWIAMAGFHQIWVADLAGGFISPAVGNSREGVTNGYLLDAELAQPSGLTFDDTGRLYFADSESSSIRWADVLAADGETGVLAGSDTNLFDFGDEDGVGTEARLQHPLGIVWDEISGDLIIADTYNSKLKRIDAESGDTTTYLGSDQGWADGANPRFYEPGGLAIDGDALYVADTNNHVIRVVDLNRDTVKTLVLHGIERFTPPPDDSDYPGTVISLDRVEVAPGPGTVQLAIALPDGYKVNEDAPSVVEFTVAGGVAELPAEMSLTGAELPVAVDAEFLSGSGLLTADVTLLYCREDSEGLCIIEQVRFNQPLDVGERGSSEIALPHQVQTPNF